MPYDINVRVRYAETDQMGVVYHSNYLVYFEIGRTEMMRNSGISYAELEERGYVLAVLESSMKHVGSAKYDDLLTVRTWLRNVTKTRLHFEYAVLREDKLLTSGHTVLAFLSRADGMRPVRAPEDAFERATLACEPVEKA
ncbi:MAG: acyl-CoA thioesterase [Planctomycetes bacterium]|nr:acyl-CoA thioesterase [Planctomycetota bacterium]MCA8934851.1 acyl-CoA thioesterase [Planctomycetota bacterium]MCA8946140.1 acyl-CoA thioesterase [Planctomycetota bacterium]